MYKNLLDILEQKEIQISHLDMIKIKITNLSMVMDLTSFVMCVSRNPDCPRAFSLFPIVEVAQSSTVSQSILRVHLKLLFILPSAPISLPGHALHHASCFMFRDLFSNLLHKQLHSPVSTLKLALVPCLPNTHSIYTCIAHFSTFFNFADTT